MAESLKTTARRNEAHKPGEEVFVLRHYRLQKGTHQAFKTASERGVWLVYEKIGTRIIGDFKYVYPEGGGSSEYDESVRLARYASYEHWLDTRRPFGMMGDGPLLDLSSGGFSTRQGYVQASDGAYFMTGSMVEALPYHLTAQGASDSDGSVRYNIPQPGDEISLIDCWQIKKGEFERFDRLTREGMLPLISKMGVRPLGIWQLIYPDTAIQNPDPDTDQVMMITRFASYQHQQATLDPANLIGDGGDYVAWSEANAARDRLIVGGWHRFVAGDLYGSPPTYIPSL